jgi:hypothetical protein
MSRCCGGQETGHFCMSERDEKRIAAVVRTSYAALNSKIYKRIKKSCKPPSS